MSTQPERPSGNSSPEHVKSERTIYPRNGALAFFPRQGGSLHFRTILSLHWGYGMTLVFLAAVSTLAGFRFAQRSAGAGDSLGSNWAKWAGAAPVQAASVSAPLTSTLDAPKTEVKELAGLGLQEQAERLLEGAIHRQVGSLDLIGQNVDNWRGRLQNTDRLFDLVLEALNSDDLRVRSAAEEIDLAANNLSKSPQSVARLVQQIRNDPAERPWALRRLGALGNRGVEPKAVLAHLQTYARNRNEGTRYWAVEGLAMLGGDDSIDPLLDRFAHDPSPRVRERAACSLAQSGMLTKEQRLSAVPHLLNLLDDDSLDATTRGWAYGALRLITGAPLGNDAGAWRKWWAHHDSEQGQPSPWVGILRA